MKKNNKPTIKQIAEQAGVSPSTVSLVLNGKGEISGVTRSRVLEVVSSLNYTPRAPKNRMHTAKTIKFLKIAKHGHTVNRDHSHFISDYIDGMSSEATSRGYKLQVLSYENVTANDIIDVLANSDATAAIILGTELTREDIQKIQDFRLPTVFIDSFYDLIDANFVDMNNGDAVYTVLSHLKDLGFSKIGFVGSETKTRNFALRKEAFLKNMDHLGLRVNSDHILSIGSTLTSAYDESVKVLSKTGSVAEAYFCANDVMAYGFTKALKEKGYRIPQNVSVVGFDNLPMSATLDPSLTTIDVSKRKIGSMAVTVLDELLNADGPLPAVKVQVGAKLVVRASTTAQKT
ncbi:LacI family DNA-binding transcriptional regulator [Thalassospira lucentensis]|uniref:LacI family transcriptional regulator n=1 Tax=Thalassospira lucentensis TaxID=168935 RepID=A0A358HRV9_9PROT|nr:LacI family DNA-binding transcriptional regulator [Thalassospira lucentensis]HBU97916.1 LacI family transcriptional regulator [Thalassospira lucentensis]HCW69101.1 LacI family transcriptional regulator [Thalassospira lucentensis]|tara:strand:+ start:8401 stop:9438 length:1038 start_codon:yes stop_codon:yes gene_type:complete